MAQRPEEWREVRQGMLGMLIVAALLAGLIIGLNYAFDCEVSGSSREEYVLLEFTKVVMHTRGCYTVFHLKDNRQYTEHTFSNARLIQDVPPGEPMYVNYKRKWVTGWRTGKEYDMGRVYDDPATIHIHDINELGGAGWDHGKAGRGHTTVIE